MHVYGTFYTIFIFGGPKCWLEEYDEYKRCDMADLERSLLNLWKPSLLCENKADIKKSAGEADLKNFAKFLVVFGADRKKFWP